GPVGRSAPADARSELSLVVRCQMLSTRNLLKRSSSLLAVAGVSVLLAGCPQPDASLDDFAARYTKANPPGPPAACGQTVQKVEGDFLFALSSSLGKTK